MSDKSRSRIVRIAKILSEVSRLDDTDMSILLMLLADSNITNAELAKILKFKDGNSISYHTRAMQQDGMIDRYTIVPNWKRVGLGTEFIILAEAESEEQLMDIEKKHVFMADEYLAKAGNIVVTPTISGCVVLQDVYHCFGDKTMAIIVGRATSDQDAAVYCKNYLTSRYPNIKTSLLINKYRTINDFIIDGRAIKKLKEYFLMGDAADANVLLEELSNRS
jgi:DNA-binding Lrp family transcriptional regulator